MSAPRSPAPDATNDVPVWDLGVRIFHWSLLVLVVAAFVTVKIGGNAMTYHAWCGYAILALLVFRIVWGFVGGTHARFTSFVRGPGAVLASLRGMLDRTRHQESLGHNPLGALSVLAMLAALLFQAVSGLFVNDDIAFEGPLYKWAGKELSDRLMSLHHLNEKVILALVALHLAAIAFYFFFHKDNLVRPMVTGIKRARAQPGASRHGSTALAIVLLAASGVGVYFLVNAAK
ncbi:MAG: cytochrome b/b6 domain-containing protein [Burkholderiales bacterium]|nr:cytochrome b/b6 domain-containing protein [Burkholderiales bacterium]